MNANFLRAMKQYEDLRNPQRMFDFSLGILDLQSGSEGRDSHGPQQNTGIACGLELINKLTTRNKPKCLATPRNPAQPVTRLIRRISPPHNNNKATTPRSKATNRPMRRSIRTRIPPATLPAAWRWAKLCRRDMGSQRGISPNTAHRVHRNIHLRTTHNRKTASRRGTVMLNMGQDLV